MANMVYGYLDESPSLHDEAFFFSVTILIDEIALNKALTRIIKRAREKLPKKERKKFPELKFSNSSPKIRNYILEAIAKQPVKVVAMVVETKSRKVADIPENYGLIVGWSLVEAVELHPAITLTLDQKFVKDSDVVAMENTVTRIVFGNSPHVLIRLTEGDSQENPMLQLADFVAGAFNYKYNRNDDSYWKLIEKVIEVEKVAKWLSLKATDKAPQATKKE